MTLEQYQKINEKIQEAQRFLLDGAILKGNKIIERDCWHGCRQVLLGAVKMIDKWKKDETI